MKVTVCIGSSCHVRGSRQVVEQLQDLIRDHNLSDEVELCGSFCMGQCQLGDDDDGTEGHSSVIEPAKPKDSGSKKKNK